eukprot:177671_1
MASSKAVLSIIDSLVEIFEHKQTFTQTNIVLDCDRISSILISSNLHIDTNTMKASFLHHKYNKHQLIDDLCDILFLSADNVLLSRIFMLELNITDESQLKRIYNLLLYRFLQKKDINNCNFIKILTFTALTINTAIIPHEINAIATKQNLTGKLFIKGTKEFQNSLKFASLFKSIQHYNKKQWTKIYITIKKKWDYIKPTPTVQNSVEEKEFPINSIPIVYSFGIKYWYNKWPKPLTENKDNIFVQSQFNNLKDEVINSNGKILLDLKRWNSEMNEAKNNQKREECKRYNVTTKGSFVFNIAPNTLIEIKHLIAVQLYCN